MDNSVDPNSDYLNINNERVQLAFSLLVEDGYFNDENSRLGSYTVEHKMSKLESLFREMGYEGSSLISLGKYYNDHGVVYWAYDEDRMTLNESKLLTDKWVESSSLI